jgi:hypothetical protein
MFPRYMVCLRNISVDTLHKGDTEGDGDDNDDDNNNNNIKHKTVIELQIYGVFYDVSI